ncbi:MAG: hypothetical protein AB1716_00205 [Planctomycetota bacterium]
MAKTTRVQKAAPPIALRAERSSDEPARPARLPLWAWINLGLLVIGGCAFGVLEVHSSTDTWIGLAAGRQVLTSPEFPVNDTFSYTFQGQPFFNQNWLSHVYFWLLYDKIAPNAVIYGTWAAAAATFFLVLAATWLRTRSWPAAFVTGGLTGTAMRDWVSARPATIQFFLLALFCLALAGLLGQRERRRWWPIALLALVFLAWPHAHGSFNFAYSLLAVFVGCDILARIVRARTVTSAAQVVAIIAIVVITVGLAIGFGPFGLENFTHQFKVVESPKFRDIGEWHPPTDFRFGLFPPIRRFWVALAVAAAFPAFVLLVRTFPTGEAAPGRTRNLAPRQKPGIPLQVILFDLAAVSAGLALAFWARRFAPYLYILGGPAIAFWTMRWARPLPAWVRSALRYGVLIAAGTGGLLALVTAASWARRDLGSQQAAELSLLERVTQCSSMPLTAIDFFAKNDLSARVFTEWKAAGLLMFHAPRTKLYIDGRSQQVYSEQHYDEYNSIRNYALPPLLDKLTSYWQTEAVLLPIDASMVYLGTALERRPEWLPIVEVPRARILVREGSQLLADLIDRERAGQLWWPELPATTMLRGQLWARHISPEDPRPALALWQRGLDYTRALLERNISTAPRDIIQQLAEVPLEWYPRIAAALAGPARGPEAEFFLHAERQKWQALPGLPDALRAQIINRLAAAEQSLRRPALGPTTPAPGSRPAVPAPAGP